MVATVSLRTRSRVVVGRSRSVSLSTIGVCVSVLFILILSAVGVAWLRCVVLVDMWDVDLYEEGSPCGCGTVVSFL